MLIIGEGPGRNEDETGLPFVGRAGKLLDKILDSVGIDSNEDAYISNIVKCRPPENRDPLPTEIDECSIYLSSQIKLMQPKLIVTLGRHSLHYRIPEGVISKIHGSITSVNNLNIFPMYHPAAALYRGNLREIIEEDYVKLGKYIKNFEFGENQ